MPHRTQPSNHLNHNPDSKQAFCVCVCVCVCICVCGGGGVGGLEGRVGGW